MPEKYINDPHLQIAMTEYQPNMKKINMRLILSIIKI